MENKKGFTLIELLIVILIIVILASFLIVGVTHYKNKARDARVISDMSQIRISAAKVYTDEGVYRSSSLCCSSGCKDEVIVNCEDIRKMARNSPQIYTNDGNNYCATVQLNNGNWYCLDSNGVVREASDNHCSDTHFSCSP